MTWEGLCLLSHRSDFAEASKAVITNSGDEPTGCATRCQQAGYVVRSGFTSNLDQISFLLALS